MENRRRTIDIFKMRFVGVCHENGIGGALTFLV